VFPAALHDHEWVAHVRDEQAQEALLLRDQILGLKDPPADGVVAFDHFVVLRIHEEKERDTLISSIAMFLVA